MERPTPNTPNMEREPALTIGEMFASKPLIKPVIAAAVAVIAGLLNLTVGEGTIENLTTLVMFAAMVYAPIAAKREQAKLATEQAAETREAVYSPATAKKLVQEAAVTGDATIAPPPAK